ncbi:hypothetical protein BXZ70DRAFT_590715 [Cristinia sonorae]|uniref:Methyltransferase domain-containing protein n=1 Tax=Cristinia sonorae TaxID=1940300 RepID=A0A8K0UV48_9AGAR|nr:hypothetical protein BXZ70DRAFT_590715 [Cristinia sonorae]
MSRGNREAVSGNIKLSMRDNYAEHGVDQYYQKVGATYRNPHFPGVRACMFLWLNNWWQAEHERLLLDRISIFDMACGHGEVTIAFMEWWKLGKVAGTSQPRDNSVTSAPRKKSTVPDPPRLEAYLPTPQILAADPFTAEAFKARTSLNCSTFSFQEIADGSLAALLNAGTEPSQDNQQAEQKVLFALLWELSLRSRWLVVLAPHKKPEIKMGWGWVKWDAKVWTECPMAQSDGEFLQDRVHCRVYRSVNLP